jgi:hypothetical protein
VAPPVAIAVAVVAVFAGWLKLRLGGTTTVRTFDDVATAVCAFAAMAFSLQAGVRHTGPSRRFWFVLGAGCGAWTVAEIIWGVYDLVLRVAVPVPSWADLGYLSAIPLVVIALVMHPAMRTAGKHRAMAALDGVVVATALFYISWSFVLGPLWRSTDLTSAGGLVALAYPFGDIVMVFLVVLVIRKLPPQERFSLCCVLAGLLAMALADSTYAYLSEVGRYSSGDLIDTGWVVGYLGMAVGAYTARPTQNVLDLRAPSAPSLNSMIAPFLPIMMALAVVALEVVTGRKLYRSDWVIAMVLTVLSLARQFFMVLDQFRLGGAGRQGEPGDEEATVP